MVEPDAEENPQWELRLAAEIIATIEVVEQDFPRNCGRVTTGDRFEELRDYFRVFSGREESLLVREELKARQISLSPQGGHAGREFTLIVEADRARFQFI